MLLFSLLFVPAISSLGKPNAPKAVATVDPFRGHEAVERPAGHVRALKAAPSPSPKIVKPATPPYSPDVFKGLGAWVDLFDTNLQPWATAQRLRNAGVKTLYLETGWSTSVHDVAPWSASWLRAAHAAGLKVVGWYTPNYKHTSKDVRRGVAISMYRAGTQRFDGLAIDIEMKSGRHWNAKVAYQMRTIRKRVPGGYPVGAIVPPPLQMENAQATWAGFPWVSLGRSADAFVLMSYWTDRSGCPEIAVHCAYQYTAGNVELTKLLAERPNVIVHIIGGGASGTTRSEMNGFIAGVVDSHADGASMYDVNSTPAWQWKYVRSLGVHLLNRR